MNASESKVVAEMVKKLTGSFGVTADEHHVTVRWNDSNGRLLQVSMVVADVVTPEQIKEEELRRARYDEMSARYKEFADALCYVEEGSWPQ